MAGRPLELEGEYPELCRRLANPKCAQTTLLPAETCQYEDLLLNDVPGRLPDAETNPSECNGIPGCVQQLHQDDAVKSFLIGCAGLEGECRNAGARPEARWSQIGGLGDRPEVLEGEARSRRSMPMGATCWMRENPLSVDAQRRVRLKAETCDKAKSADTCTRLTGFGVRDTGVVCGYAEGCAKHSATEMRTEGCEDAELMPAGTGASDVDVMSRGVVVLGGIRSLPAKVRGYTKVRR
jgi:hypothetical protein